MATLLRFELDMRTNLPTLVILVLFLVGNVGLVEARGPRIPTDVKKSAQARIQNGYTVGIVIGIVSEKGASYFTFGKLAINSEKPLDKNSVFEIGSITKVFTGILLANMVKKGEVALDDPIQKYLPKKVKIPRRDGKQISFLNLSTQFSGLPRMPDNMDFNDPDNPYADYTVDQMYDFLSGHTLARDIGQSYEYSNLAVGLLGHVLSLRAGKTYEELIRERILDPLQMTHSGINLSQEMVERLATGHVGGQEVANWDLPTLAGAGALRSSAKDMIKFISANIGLSKHSLQKAMDLSHEPRFGIGVPDMKIGLGWHIRTDGDKEIVWHNGGTGGYRSFAGFIKKETLGVVVLTNSVDDIDDLGFRILEPSFPLKKIKTPVRVHRKILQKYEGKYTLNPSLIIDFRVVEGSLTGQITGQKRYDLYPSSETTFFLPSPEANLSFELDGKGLPQAVVLEQGGIKQRAAKVGDDYEPPPAKKEVAVDPKILETYVGKYQLAPRVLFDVKLDKGQLQVMLTGQSHYPVFPESSTKFFYKIVYAQITFVKEKGGTVTSLILHQNGQDQPASKIE